MEQSRLFEPALEAVQLSCFWSYPGGWEVRIATRRSGESWGMKNPFSYSELVTAELLDVITVELAALFGVTD